MRLAVLGMILLACGQPAAAQQVRFTGETRADERLIADALQQLARHAYATQNCATLTELEATVLPESFDPGPRYRVQPAGVRYERWNAILCGRSVAYLIGFWPSAEGGFMFQVSHPFPEVVQSAPH